MYIHKFILFTGLFLVCGFASADMIKLPTFSFMGSVDVEKNTDKPLFYTVIDISKMVTEKFYATNWNIICYKKETDAEGKEEKVRKNTSTRPEEGFKYLAEGKSLIRDAVLTALNFAEWPDKDIKDAFNRYIVTFEIFTSDNKLSPKAKFKFDLWCFWIKPTPYVQFTVDGNYDDAIFTVAVDTEIPDNKAMAANSSITKTNTPIKNVRALITGKN